MATSYLAAVAMQELVRYQGRWFRAEISGGKEEICFWYQGSSFQDSWATVSWAPSCIQIIQSKTWRTCKWKSLMHSKHILHGKSLNISMVLKHLLLPHATSISFLPHNNHDTWYSLEWCCSTIKCHHVSHRVPLCCVHWIPWTWQKPHRKKHVAEVFWIASPPSSRVHFRKSHPNSWPRSQNILCGPHVDHISLASVKCRWSAMNLSRVNCFPRQSVLIFHQQLQTWWYHKARTQVALPSTTTKNRITFSLPKTWVPLNFFYAAFLPSFLSCSYCSVFFLWYAFPSQWSIDAICMPLRPL